MTVIYRYRVIFFILVLCTFQVLGHYTIGRDQSKLVFDSLVVGTSAAVMMTFFKSGVRALFRGVQHGGDNLLAGTWLLSTSLFLLFCYIVVFQVTGRPDWLRQTPIAGLISVLLFSAGALAVTTPLNTAQLPRPDLTWWLLGISIGSMVTGAVIMAAVYHIIVL